MKHAGKLIRRFPGIASILRNGAILSGTQWTEAGLRGIYALVIAAWLGPELYGSWSFATTFYTFAIALTIFGFDVILPLRLGRDRKADALVGATFFVRGCLLVLATALLAVYALALEDDMSTQLALLLVLPALIGRGVVLWSRSVFLGLDQNTTALRLAAAFRVLEVSAGLTSLALSAGLHVLLAIHALAWIAEAAFSFRAVSRQITVSLDFDREEFKSTVADGFLLGLATASLAVLTAMPLILTRNLIDDLEIVGHMALAMQIAALAVMGAQGLLSAALPVVGRATSNDDPRLRLYPILVAVGAVAFFGLAIVVAIEFGASSVLALMGSGFAPAGHLLAPALLVGGMTILPIGFWQILAAQGRTWSGVAAGWSGALVLLVILPPMVQASGASGALYAAAIGWTVRAAILIGWALGFRKAGISRGR